MLLSMTGFGEARWQGPDLTISVELRSVNNRFLKINVKTTEAYQALETEIDRTLRETLKRGTVNVQLQVYHQPRPDDFQINFVALEAYQKQLKQYAQTHSITSDLSLGSLLPLPGVVDDVYNRHAHDTAEDWGRVSPVVLAAIKQLQMMRADEGLKMARELRSLLDVIRQRLNEIQVRAPEVASDFRKRLHDKLQNILNDHSIVLDPSTLIKEVAIFADRTDIHEEIVRLASHLEQFHAFLEEKESAGRKLDFLVQEMNREVNTIGSKGNDLVITRHVVEMKGVLEKIRELIQNVE